MYKAHIPPYAKGFEPCTERYWPARLRTRYRAQDPVQGSGPGTGALLSHPGQYLYCTRPIYTYTGPVQGLYTRIQALYRYRAPSIGERLFPINQCWETHPGWGRGISPRPRVLGRISSTKYSGLPCSMSRLGSSGPARARARNDLVLAVLGL